MGYLLGRASLIFKLPDTGQYIIAIIGGLLVVAGVLVAILVLFSKNKDNKDDDNKS